jgi:hypothetical protein
MGLVRRILAGLGTVAALGCFRFYLSETHSRHIIIGC